MSNKIQVRRGNFSDLPTGDPGEPLLTSDSQRFYLGTTTGNMEVKTVSVAAQILYVTTTANGADTAANGHTGLPLASGTATATGTPYLYDSGASFTAALVGHAIYNSTDDTWAKVTAFVSQTQLTLSAHIMASGEAYVIVNALTTVADAFSALKEGYSAEAKIQISDGTFSGDVTFIGKTSSDDVTLTLQGSITGTTTLSGNIVCRQRMTWKNLTLTGSIKTYSGSDIIWNTCTTSGASKLYIYGTAANDFTSCTVTVANDPTNITQASSTITIGYTMYVATTALGGNDAVADGLAITNGSATSTSANKLVDSGAAFTSALVGKTVYNSTDDTWAKVDAVDSATQLSLSADIMASGEAYVLADAFSTIQGAVNAVPGTVNCITAIKVCNGTFNENVVVQGKSFSGTYYITIRGTLLDQLGVRNVTAATQTTATIDGAAMTASAHIGQLVKIVAGTGVDQRAIVYSNTTTVLTIMGSWNGSTSGIAKGLYTGVYPTTASDVKVCTWGTLIDSVKLVGGQKAVLAEDVKLISGDPAIPGSFVVDGLSAGELYGSWINNGASYRGVYCLNGSLGDCVSTYIESCSLTQYAANSMGNMYNVWSKKRISPSLNSMLVFRAGRIDMTGTANQHGMDIEGMSVWAAGYDAGTAVTLTGASGTGYDLSARAASLSRGSTNANNTIGTKNIDASSTET